jgi:putative ABC transport system permease protein
MALAFCLAATSLIVGVQLIGSISGLYKTAQPPHFLQMHKGEINQVAIDEFSSGYEGIESWQTVNMIDVYGDSLTVQNDNKLFSLSDCRLDISLVKQNDTKDLLLNNEKEKVSLNAGQIGIPVILKEAYDIKIGDHIILNENGVTKEFVVTEFVHDAKMNSTMCSSTRILISNEDFNYLNGRVGENEYLIEAYFEDSSMAMDYQTAYENAGLPQNGQAVTYTIIFLLSALTDLIMAFVLLFASILLILIAVMCIRFTVMATMEEELGEIGTMKAIGMSFQSIRNIYLVKYRTLAAGGGIIGYVMALIISNVFTSHISSTFGKMNASVLTIVFPIAACVLIFLLVDYYSKKILKKINKVTVVDALVTGDGFKKKKNKVKDGFYKAKKYPVNLLIAVREVVINFGNWVIMFIVMLVATAIILIPMNMLNTIKSPRFISYMGSDLEDILIKLNNGDGIETRYLEAKSVLKSDSDIISFNETCRVRVATYNSENKLKNIYIDCGDKSGEGLQYLSGYAPKEENEIAISYLISESIGKKVGDSITLIGGNTEREFIISGIYQDVTSGGYTAKSKNIFLGVERELYSFSLSVKDNIEVKQKAEELSNLLGVGFTVEPMEEFINQTLGGVISQLNLIVVLIMITGLFLAGLIAVLFMKLRLAKDYSQIAAMKAIGFSVNDVRKQYLVKTGIISFLGIFAGTILANTAGEGVINLVLKFAGFGITRIHFIINPLLAYVVCPLILILAVMLMTWLCTKQIRQYNIISLINE